MFMHNVMSFAARKELLAYGYARGERAMRGDLAAFLTEPAQRVSGRRKPDLPPW